MIQIINGKKYDTSTADAMGSFNYTTPGDLWYQEETLYRTKKGSYFLFGLGGEGTECSLTNRSGCMPKITPITEAEAREWVEKYLTGPEYIKIFGDVEEA